MGKSLTNILFSATIALMMTGIIISSLLLLVRSTDHRPPSDWSKSSTITINNFDGFVQDLDDSYIDSSKSSSEISFSYDGVTASLPLYEGYRLTFDSEGNCTDFEIATTLTYSLEGIDDHLTFQIIMSSYYTYNGTYISPPSGSTHLCLTGIWDGWDESGGKHVVRAWPYDTSERYTTDYGAIGLSGTVKLYMKRDDGTLLCQVTEEDVTPIISHSWSAGVDKPVNCIYIRFTSGKTTSTVSGTISAISGALEVDETGASISIAGFTAIIATCGFLAIATIVIIPKKQKR